MGRRRGARFAPQPQPLADMQLFADRHGRTDPDDRDPFRGDRMPEAGSSLMETSHLLSDAGSRPGGGLYRYQNPGKHRMAIEQRYGNNE